MKRASLIRISILLGFIALVVGASACRQVETLEPALSPAELHFSGDRALALESEFIEEFPERVSGGLENRKAADWLQMRLADLGYECILDEWETINYSRVVPLANVICRLEGAQEASIVLLSHYDHSPFAEEGADDSASGVATALHLAEILAEEGPGATTIDIVFTDGSLYGALGARRLVDVHPEPGRIKAVVAIDNLGLPEYETLGADPQGQFSGYGPLWLQLAAADVGQANPDSASVSISPLLEQIGQQAIPLSFEDQGALVAAGWPAIGLYGQPNRNEEDSVWQVLYSIADDLAKQSADTLEQNGRLVEGLIRQLQMTEENPTSRSPYLYFEGQDRVLGRGAILAILLGFVLIFVVASYFAGRKAPAGYWRGLLDGWPHFLGLWAPLAASIVILVLFVHIGLIDEYDVYPATLKDPAITKPKLMVIFLWLVALWELLQLGRRLTALYMADRPVPSHRQIRALAYLVLAVGYSYVLIQNPMSLVLLFPTVTWLLIRERSDWRILINILLLLAGFGLVIWALGFLGFDVIHNSLAVLWYFMIFSGIESISIPTALAVTAILAAGLALVVSPVQLRHREEPTSDEITDPAGESRKDPETLEPASQ